MLAASVPHRALLAFALVLSASIGSTGPAPAARHQPPDPQRVIERVAVYSAQVVLRRDGRVRVRTLPGQLLTVARTGDQWEDPLSSEPLSPARVRKLREGQRPPTRCGPRRKRGRWSPYTPLRLTARSEGVSVAGVFAFARLSPARKLVRPETGQRFDTQQVEACASGRIEAGEGTRLDTAVVVTTAATGHSSLIGWSWGRTATDGVVRDAGFALRGRAAVDGSATLGGGLGPAELPGTGIDDFVDNQIYGEWTAASEISSRGPAGNVALALWERPKRAPLPRITIQIAAAYRSEG
jgi:hypothetical protein